MKDALRGRLADAVDVLADLDAVVEHAADRLPPLTLARALVKFDALAADLAGLRLTLASAGADPSGGAEALDAVAAVLSGPAPVRGVILDGSGIVSSSSGREAPST